jgi:hypothetical protein
MIQLNDNDVALIGLAIDGALGAEHTNDPQREITAKDDALKFVGAKLGIVLDD